MNLEYLIYPGTEEFNLDKANETIESLGILNIDALELPQDVFKLTKKISKSRDLSKSIKKLLETNVDDKIIFFQEAGVTNSESYMQNVVNAVQEGAILGCAKWKYETSDDKLTNMISDITKYGCNFASKYGVIHNNGFMTSQCLKYLSEGDKPFSEMSYKAKNEKFAFLKNDFYIIPLGNSIHPVSKWINEDLPNAWNTLKKYTKK